MALTLGPSFSIRGPQGVAGLSFLTGSGAPSVAGAEGQGYLDAQAGDLYAYTGGSWSKVRSIIGPMGLNGIDGSFFAGTGVPDSSTYNGAGQAVYIRANGQVYIYQGNGAWQDTGENLTGPQGVAGQDGLRGSQIYHDNKAFDPANFPNAQPGDMFFRDDLGNYAYITN